MKRAVFKWLFLIDFKVIWVVAIRLNMKYYRLRGDPGKFVMKRND